jgi:hypothetical protein
VTTAERKKPKSAAATPVRRRFGAAKSSGNRDESVRDDPDPRRATFRQNLAFSENFGLDRGDAAVSREDLKIDHLEKIAEIGLVEIFLQRFRPVANSRSSKSDFSRARQ